MSTQYVTTAKTARMEAVRALINTGSGTSCVKIYTTPRPATGGAPTGATILASLDLPADCGSVANGILTLTLPSSSTVLANGDHNWARVFDRDGGIVADMGTGLTGSAADMEIPVATLYAGATLKPTAGYLRDY